MKQITPELLAQMGVPLMSLNDGFQSDSPLSPDELQAQNQDKVPESEFVRDDLPCMTKSLIWLDGGLKQSVGVEGSLVWKLWQNMANVFGWQVENTWFLAPENYPSEEACFALLEEVMAQPIELAIVSESHPLKEMLSEGLQVIEVSSLEDLIESPNLKKELYLKLS